MRYCSFLSLMSMSKLLILSSFSTFEGIFFCFKLQFPRCHLQIYNCIWFGQKSARSSTESCLGCSLDKGTQAWRKVKFKVQPRLWNRLSLPRRRIFFFNHAKLCLITKSSGPRGASYQRSYLSLFIQRFSSWTWSYR